jgi:class 3 adenylate cyclase/YHS domain-containing protein
MTQTFLFADLAGFSALTEAHGDEQAADLVGAFCQEARNLLPQHGGEEVKAIGDALMIRVEEPSEAVRLGLRLAHEVGGRHGFPAVRVGVHSGPAVQREEDWFGATVNIAARVSTAATAGDVLVTRATRDVVASELREEVEFRERGPQTFKNISEPVEVFAVVPVGEAASGRLATDPICQMAVDPAHAAATRRHGGQEFFFCSQACAETFDRDPQRFKGPRSRRSDLRASDEARERAVHLLRRAYERGRLTVEELEERVAHAHAARTRGELRLVLRDLPEYGRARARMRRRRMWRALLPWRPRDRG